MPACFPKYQNGLFFPFEVTVLRDLPAPYLSEPHFMGHADSSLNRLRSAHLQSQVCTLVFPSSLLSGFWTQLLPGHYNQGCHFFLHEKQVQLCVTPELAVLYLCQNVTSPSRNPLIFVPSKRSRKLRSSLGTRVCNTETFRSCLEKTSPSFSPWWGGSYQTPLQGFSFWPFLFSWV